MCKHNDTLSFYPSDLFTYNCPTGHAVGSQREIRE